MFGVDGEEATGALPAVGWVSEGGNAWSRDFFTVDVDGKGASIVVEGILGHAVLVGHPVVADVEVVDVLADGGVVADGWGEAGVGYTVVGCVISEHTVAYWAAGLLGLV